MPSTAEAITADLRARLTRAEWPLDARIPPLNDLCEHYDVTGTTMRRAQAPLIEEGWLRPEQGRGVYVAAIPPAAQIDPLDTALAALDQAATALAAARRAVLDKKG